MQNCLAIGQGVKKLGLKHIWPTATKKPSSNAQLVSCVKQQQWECKLPFGKGDLKKVFLFQKMCFAVFSYELFLKLLTRGQEQMVQAMDVSPKSIPAYLYFFGWDKDVLPECRTTCEEKHTKILIRI